MSTMATGEPSSPCKYTNPKAVSRVSPSIVRLTYYEGSCKNVGNGTIFSCIRDDDNAQFVSYILTTGDLFDLSLSTKSESEEEEEDDEEEEEDEEGVISKLHVCLSTHVLYEGELMVCDKEMNIVVVKIKSYDALPVATLTPFTDWISLAPCGVSESDAEFCLSPYPTKLFPGDEVAIVCQETSRVRVITGIHSVDRLHTFFDGKPVLRINCEDIIDGAPVINCEGDVIGVAFTVSEVCVGFLPVNIFLKWWKHVLEYGEICRPKMGMTVTNLYAADICDLEDDVHDCNVYDGVLIDVVFPMGPACSAGMSPWDVIFQCDERPVRSLLELFEFMWDKSGEVIEAKGVRNGCHLVWKVEIQAIKASLVPESLAKSFAENNATRKKRDRDNKKSKKDRRRIIWKVRARKMDSRSSSAEERKLAHLGISKCSGIRKVYHWEERFR